MTTDAFTQPPRRPEDFTFLIEHFTTTPGVRQALIVSSDGMPLIASANIPPDSADPLAAMTERHDQPRQQHRRPRR